MEPKTDINTKEREIERLKKNRVAKGKGRYLEVGPRGGDLDF